MNIEHILDYNCNHPECKPGEIFYMNIYTGKDDFYTNKHFEGIVFLTKRQGKHSFDSEGESLSQCTPVFVQRWEYYVWKIVYWSLITIYTCILTNCINIDPTSRQVNAELIQNSSQLHIKS